MWATALNRPQAPAPSGRRRGHEPAGTAAAEKLRPLRLEGLRVAAEDVGHGQAKQVITRLPQQAAGGGVGVDVARLVIGEQDGLDGVLEHGGEPLARARQRDFGLAARAHVAPAHHQAAVEARLAQGRYVALEDPAVEPLDLVDEL